MATALAFSTLGLRIPTGIGPTEDDVSLVWLNGSCTTESAISLLRSPFSQHQRAGIGEIFSGPIFPHLLQQTRVSS